MWFGPVNEGIYVHVVCSSSLLDIRNCCRDLDDLTMTTGTTKGRPCKVVWMFLGRGLNTLLRILLMKPLFSFILKEVSPVASSECGFAPVTLSFERFFDRCSFWEIK